MLPTCLKNGQAWIS